DWSEHGFRMSPDGTVETLTPPVFYGTAINEAGQVVGQGYNQEGLIAWRGTGSTFEDLRFLPAPEVSPAAVPLGVGPAGEGGGYAFTAGGAVRAFLYRDGQGMVPLDSVASDPRWTFEFPNAMGGTFVVGTGQHDGQPRGFRADLATGAVLDLGESAPA